MTQDDIYTLIGSLGIVPVVNIENPEKAERLALSLIEGGIPCVEVTLRTDGAFEAIRRIRRTFPDLAIGAGTVVNRTLARKAVKAGANFIVSPFFDRDTIKWCLKKRIAVIPGVMTPTEIGSCLALGISVVKFFPAESAGGVSMIKALSGPFPQVKFITTGGIDMKKLPEYSKISNILAVGGSWMAKSDLIENEKWNEIARLSREALGIMKRR